VNRALFWLREDAPGAEFCTVRLDVEGLQATGVAVGGQPAPYRLDYELATDRRLVTRRVELWSTGGTWSRELHLEHDGAGAWTCRVETHGQANLPPAGGDDASLVGALDCDIGFSPLTNTMPILREGVRAKGRASEILAAWVSVPDLGVTASKQTYEGVGPDRVRYRSGSFSAILELDEDGFVRIYPGLARRGDEAA
jgi:uncharacterized protein